ncbi:MAG: phasin family protein [Pseudomonadota bacterium]
MTTRQPKDAPTDMIEAETHALDALTDLQAAGFGTLAAMGSAFADALNEMSSEAVGFMARRLEEDLDTQRRIFACTSMEDLQAVQSDFLRTAMARYSEETGRIMAIGDRLVRTAAERAKT